MLPSRRDGGWYVRPRLMRRPRFRSDAGCDPRGLSCRAPMRYYVTREFCFRSLKARHEVIYGIVIIAMLLLYGRERAEQ